MYISKATVYKKQIKIYSDREITFLFENSLKKWVCMDKKLIK